MWKVVILGGLGGRLDQEMQNLNTMVTWAPTFAQITIVTEDCLVTHLPPGRIRVNCIVPHEGRECGLLPLLGPVASLTTSGLHWDVSEWETRFGGQVSTSNRLDWYDTRPSISKHARTGDDVEDAIVCDVPLGVVTATAGTGRAETASTDNADAAAGTGSPDTGGNAGATTGLDCDCLTRTLPRNACSPEVYSVTITVSHAILWTSSIHVEEVLQYASLHAAAHSHTLLPDTATSR